MNLVMCKSGYEEIKPVTMNVWRKKSVLSQNMSLNLNVAVDCVSK